MVQDEEKKNGNEKKKNVNGDLKNDKTCMICGQLVGAAVPEPKRTRGRPRKVQETIQCNLCQLL